MCKTMATISVSIKEQKQVSFLGSMHTDPQLPPFHDPTTNNGDRLLQQATPGPGVQPGSRGILPVPVHCVDPE